MKTFDNLEVGDVIVHEDGDTAKVLAILGGVFLRSVSNTHAAAYGWYTNEEAQADGWTVRHPEAPLPKGHIIVDGVEYAPVKK